MAKKIKLSDAEMQQTLNQILLEEYAKLIRRKLSFHARLNHACANCLSFLKLLTYCYACCTVALHIAGLFYAPLIPKASILSLLLETVYKL